MNILEVEKIINKLLHHTEKSLLSVQKSKVPHYVDLKLHKVNKYLYEGIEYKANNITFRIDNIDDIIIDNTFIKYKGPLLDVINTKLNLFILFIDGVAIDFKNINIIKDSRYMYLEILKCDKRKFSIIDMEVNGEATIKLPPLPNKYSDVKFKIIPDISFRINGEYKGINRNTVLEYNNHVKINHIGKVSIDLEYSFNSIYKAEYSPNEIKTILFPAYTTIDNINNSTPIDNTQFILCNGMYYTKEEFNSKNRYLQGYNISFSPPYVAYADTGVSNDNMITIDINRKYRVFKDTLITFSNGYIDDNIEDTQFNIFNTSERMTYIYYLYMDNISKSNANIYSDLVFDINKIKSEIPKPYIKNIIKPLDFQFTQGMKKQDRIFSIIEKVCTHNTSLFQEYIDNKSTIESYSYAYDEIIQNGVVSDINTKSYNLYFSRYNNMSEKGLLFFRNGILENDISFEIDQICIRLKNIEQNDILEIIEFKNINNNNINLYIEDISTTHLIGNYIDPKNVIIQSYDINNHIYKYIPKKESLQYEIPYTIEDIGKGEILLHVPEYYVNNNISLSSKRKFIHEEYIISDDEYKINDLYKILLSDTFMYCSNMDQFMIFHNKRRVSNRDAFICINKWNLPFDKRFIHLNVKCKVNDVIDIYYLPDVMSEIYYSDTLDTNGYIEIDKLQLGYNFEYENSSIFINGKKIYKKNISNISSDTIRVNSNVQTLKNVAVLKHITYTDDMFRRIASIKSEWDSMISKLSNSELDELFGFNVFIDDIEPDMRANIYTTNMVLYEIVRRYWIINDRKVKVENPIFNVTNSNEQFILPYNSNITMIDINMLLRKYYIADNMLKSLNGIRLFPMPADFEYNYNMLDLPSYQEYSQDGSTTISSDSNIFFNDIEHIIDLLAKAGILLENTDINAITIDSLLEYIVDNSIDLGLIAYSSIDASIIRPYFYRKEIVMNDDKIYNVFPIPIDSKLDQIIDLPQLYDKDVLLPMGVTRVRFKSSLHTIVLRIKKYNMKFYNRIDKILNINLSIVIRIDKSFNIKTSLIVPKSNKVLGIYCSFINAPNPITKFSSNIMISLNGKTDIRSSVTIVLEKNIFIPTSMKIPNYTSTHIVNGRVTIVSRGENNINGIVKIPYFNDNKIINNKLYIPIFDNIIKKKSYINILKKTNSYNTKSVIKIKKYNIEKKMKCIINIIPIRETNIKASIEIPSHNKELHFLSNIHTISKRISNFNNIINISLSEKYVSIKSLVTVRITGFIYYDFTFITTGTDEKVCYSKISIPQFDNKISIKCSIINIIEKKNMSPCVLEIYKYMWYDIFNCSLITIKEIELNILSTIDIQRVNNKLVINSSMNIPDLKFKNIANNTFEVPIFTNIKNVKCIYSNKVEDYLLIKCRFKTLLYSSRKLNKCIINIII